MNGQGSQLQCRKCSHAPALQPAGNYDDGSLRMLCGCCRADAGVLHRCSHDHPATQPRWLPLLLEGISLACPNCKTAYDLGVKIEQVNPEAGEFLKAAGLFVGTVILVNVIAEIFRGKKRRH